MDKTKDSPPHQKAGVQNGSSDCYLSNTQSLASVPMSGSFWCGGKLEIIFFARGGQGAKSAAEILAQGAVQEGKFVQAFPSFGPERSGAPTETYLRISDREIRTHEPIVNPDIIVVLDETLLKTEKKSAQIWIINSARSASELKDRFKLSGEVYPIDANGISLEIIGVTRPNTVILGKLVKIIKMVKIESVIEEFKKIFENKIGREICAKNIEAIEKAYE